MAEADGPSRLGPKTALLPALGLVAVLWLSTRPYLGIIHDSAFYTMLALRHLQPERFASDLFVAFGSQDSFTLFSRLYAPLIERLGPGTAALLLTVAGQVLWLAGAGVLARAVFPGRADWPLALAGLVALPNYYGGQFTFSFGEGFMTPRLFAEAATMAGLASAIRGRIRAAWLPLAAAAALHPIMILPGLAMLFAWNVRDIRWLVAAAAGLAVALGAAFAGIQPFAGLWTRLDPEWFRIVSLRSPDLFLERWSWAQLTVTAGQAGLATIAGQVLGGTARRLTRTVLLVAAGGVVSTAVGADLLRDQLVISLQPWRATWLLGMTANLLAIPTLAVLAGDASRSAVYRLAVGGGVGLLGAAVIWPVAFLASTALLVPAALVPAAASWSARRSPGPASPPSQDAPGGMPPALVAVAVGAAGAVTVLAVQAALEAPVSPPLHWRVFGGRLTFMAGFGLLSVMTLAPRRCRTAVVAAVTAVLVATAAVCWDQRSALSRFAETGRPPPPDLAAFVPQGKTVVWSSGLSVMWFRLRQASYYSCAQGSGIVFFRDTALAYAHRHDSFRFEPLVNVLCTRDDGQAPTRPTEPELRRACGRERELDYIVLSEEVSGLPVETWDPPAPFWNYRIVADRIELHEMRRFFRYACPPLR